MSSTSALCPQRAGQRRRCDTEGLNARTGAEGSIRITKGDRHDANRFGRQMGISAQTNATRRGESLMV